jgi:hypothetical protein
MMWAPKNGGDPPQKIGMSLDEEGHVCYLEGEKRIEGGDDKKEAVGTMGSFVVAKELGMPLGIHRVRQRAGLKLTLS